MGVYDSLQTFVTVLWKYAFNERNELGDEIDQSWRVYVRERGGKRIITDEWYLSDLPYNIFRVSTRLGITGILMYSGNYIRGNIRLSWNANFSTPRRVNWFSPHRLFIAPFQFVNQKNVQSKFVLVKLYFKGTSVWVRKKWIWFFDLIEVGLTYATMTDSPQSPPLFEELQNNKLSQNNFMEYGCV